MISDDPYPIFFVIQSIIDFQLIQESIPSIVGSLLLIVVFLILSALFSASENALFSLSSKDMEEIKGNETPSNKAILTLLQNPKKLLATILIANNFVNVSLIIVSSSLIDSVFVFKDENIEEFSEKIKLVFNDEVLSKKLSENAKKSFDEDYNIEKNILKLQEIYSKYAIKN